MNLLKKYLLELEPYNFGFVLLLLHVVLLEFHVAISLLFYLMFCL